MIDVFYSDADKPFVLASDLHAELKINTPLRKWMPNMIEYGFVENQDFNQMDKIVHLDQGGSTTRKEWEITLDMAKSIAMIQKSPQGKAIREYLLNLDKQVSEGFYLNQSQIKALFEICKVIGYFSVQEYFEQEHYNKFIAEKGLDWWGERARLFGYTATELKKAMKEVGVKYANQRQALFKLDKYELVRIGVTELFVVIGKGKAYAKNVGNIAKDMAKELKTDIYNDINTSIDFKSDDKNKIIIDLKNYASHSSTLNAFKNSKQTPKINPHYNQNKLFDGNNPK